MKEIDWEERYFEMVKAIVTGKLAAGGNFPNNLLNPTIVRQILGEVKKVIEELRERAYLIEKDTAG